MRNDFRAAKGAKQRTKRHPAVPVPVPRTLARDPLAATPDKVLPFVRALAADVEVQTAASLGLPVTAAALLSVAEAAHQRYDQTWGYVQSLNVVQHACRAGCDSCCYLTVETSAPEVFLLAQRLRATRRPEQLDLLRERLQQTAARVAGLTPTERVHAVVPCALLEDGKCSAHDARPLGCRAWNSRDAQACARVLRDGGGDLRPVQDQRPIGIQIGIQTGLEAALGRAGLPGGAGGCELNTALEIALTDPQALQHWLNGHDVLQPARTAMRYSD